MPGLLGRRAIRGMDKNASREPILSRNNAELGAEGKRRSRQRALDGNSGMYTALEEGLERRTGGGIAVSKTEAARDRQVYTDAAKIGHLDR